jgi:large subunit ribosomal protein L21
LTKEKAMTMYAVIRAGGKQYRVAPEDVLDIDRISGEPGDNLEFADVLLLGGGEGEPQIGAPLVSGATVAAELVEHRRGEKIIIFKKKRRQNYRRKKGHRQELTTIRITQILSDGEKPKKEAKAKTPVEKSAAAEKGAAKEAKAAPAEGAQPKTEKAPKAKAKPAKTEE